MGFQDRKILMDVSAWAGNVSTSVLIIFINKVLMSKTGYGFRYGQSLTLTVCHAASVLVGVKFSLALPSTEHLACLRAYYKKSRLLPQYLSDTITSWKHLALQLPLFVLFTTLYALSASG